MSGRRQIEPNSARGRSFSVPARIRSPLTSSSREAGHAVAFAQRYKARFNQDVELYAPFSYDAALAMIAAVRKADSLDRGKIVARLPGVSVTGVTGKISFDERGDLIKPPYTLFRVEQGQWHSIRTVGGASN